MSRLLSHQSIRSFIFEFVEMMTWMILVSLFGMISIMDYHPPTKIQQSLRRRLQEEEVSPLITDPAANLNEEEDVGNGNKEDLKKNYRGSSTQPDVASSTSTTAAIALTVCLALLLLGIFIHRRHSNPNLAQEPTSIVVYHIFPPREAEPANNQQQAALEEQLEAQLSVHQVNRGR